MPNPFPGMDPYLEGPLWTTVHSSLVNEIAHQLAPKLRPRYLLASDVHYLEIDLLRVGERFPLAGPLPSVPYFVFLSRAARRPRVEVWPIPLEQPLPAVPVPLLPGDPDVFLDLQEALQAIYDWYSYDRAADHSGEPRVPLSPDQQGWADRLLRAAGLRP